jgi:hypothetical protein
LKKTHLFFAKLKQLIAPISENRNKIINTTNITAFNLLYANY